MKNLFGKIRASLIEKDGAVSDELVEKINVNIKPPARVTADDVHIRAMYIVSDQVNSYGGCFPADEHRRLTEFLIDSPVLIGHRKDSLPIARNFHAEEVKRDGANWVKVYFYWLKKADNGEDLRKNIDAGIYKECSISFIFNFPECSICGEDIRQCRHRPFEKYETDSGETRTAHFNYRQVAKVLETSLVYRGSVHDTSITDQLFFDGGGGVDAPEETVSPTAPQYRRIWYLDRLDAGKNYLLMPAYESLRLVLSSGDGEMRAFSACGDKIESTRLDKYLSGLTLPGGDWVVECRLVGNCGKERQPVGELLRFLRGEKSSVRRLNLKAADLLSLDGRDMTAETGGARRSALEKLFADHPKRLIHVFETAGDGIGRSFVRATTRLGVEIFECDSSGRYLMTNPRSLPAVVRSVEKSGDGYRYGIAASTGDKDMVVSDSVFSNVVCREGDMVEIETLSASVSDNSVVLARPKIVDNYSRQNRLDDIGLLMDRTPPDHDEPSYLFLHRDDGSALLSLHEKERTFSFSLQNFDMQLLDRGRRFLADAVECDSGDDNEQCLKGAIISRRSHGDSVRLSMSGELESDYLLRPVRKNGARRYVFHKVTAGNSAPAVRHNHKRESQDENNE